MRFSIRDLLWATLVVAMGLGWWLHYRATASSRLAMEAERRTAIKQAHRLRNTLEQAWTMWPESTRNLTREKRGLYTGMFIDWDILDESIPQP